MNRTTPHKFSLAMFLHICALLMYVSAAGAATISVIGTNAPTPGPDDQYQTNFIRTAISPPPGGGDFNYYVNANPSPGQTFTTGNNPNGYILSSLALFDADNTSGGFSTTAQTFSLGVYSVSGSSATLITTYTSQSIALPDFNWFQWTNLNVILQPNTQYAYAMWQNGSGWMNLGNTNVAYAGGQVALVPRLGGTMTFSTSSPWNASFSVGLTPITAVVVGQASFSSGSVAIPGTSVTANAPVSGPGPYYFQWKTDGGGGGALTNIPGATSSNLVINTTGFADGYYQYVLAVSNDTSSATGQVGVLQIQHPIGIPGVIAVKFAFTNGYSTTDDVLPADNTGVATGQLVPPSNVPLTVVGNWNNLRADVVGAGSQAAAINQTWTIERDTTGTPLTNVTLTPFGFNDGWRSGGTGCAAGRLLYNVWKFNQNAANPQVNENGHLYATLTFNNLPWTKYDVYVYVNNNNGNYWGNMKANSVVAQGASSVDDTGHGFNGASADPCSLGTPLHTFGAFGTPANYVRMANVGTDGGNITITVVSFGGGDMGIAGVELVPAPDLNLVQDLTPNYVESVTGQPLTLTTAFSNSPPVNFQWVKISGGVTNNVNTGVTTTTNSDVVTSSLSFASLQPTDSGSYLVKVSNSGNPADYTYTSEGQVIVSNLPAPVGNVVVYREAQAGQNYYPPFWSLNNAENLVYGLSLGTEPTPGTAVPGVGNYALNNDGSGNPGVLTDGELGYIQAKSVTCGEQGSGASLTYYLQTNSAPLGFELTNVTVYAGWLDGGRRDQAYQVLYSTIDAPTNFTPLYTMLYLPADPTGVDIASRTKLIPATGALAHNVYGVMLKFSGVRQLLNGYSLYHEVVVGGTNSTTVTANPALPPITLAGVNAGGALLLTGSGGVTAANNSYTILSTTNLVPPVDWVTNQTGFADGFGVFSNTLAIDPTQRAQFFRVQLP